MNCMFSFLSKTKSSNLEDMPNIVSSAATHSWVASSWMVYHHALQSRIVGLLQTPPPQQQPIANVPSWDALFDGHLRIVMDKCIYHRD